MPNLATRQNRALSYEARTGTFYDFIEDAINRYATPFDANETDCQESRRVLLQVYKKAFEQMGRIPDAEDIGIMLSDHNADIVMEIAEFDYAMNDSELGYSSYIDEGVSRDEAVLQLLEYWWEDIDNGQNHYSFWHELAEFYDELGLSYVDNYGQDVYAYAGRESAFGPDARVVNCYDIVVGDCQNVLIPEIHVAELTNNPIYMDEAGNYLRLSAHGKERFR